MLASGPGALLSHYSAGWLHGLIATRPVPVHVTAPVPRRRRDLIRMHHSRTLIDADRAESLYAAMGPGVETSGGSAGNTMYALARPYRGPSSRMRR